MILKMKSIVGKWRKRLTGGLIPILAIFLMMAFMMTGCGTAGTGASSEATTEKDYSSLVADKSEMIDEDDL